MRAEIKRVQTEKRQRLSSKTSEAATAPKALLESTRQQATGTSPRKQDARSEPTQKPDPLPPRFKTQMVILQRHVTADNQPATSSDGVQSAPETKERPPHLLEISSNCNWESIRSVLLGKLSVVCRQMGDFPPPSTFSIDQFAIAILPKPTKMTPIPPNLRTTLQAREMHSIRLRITSLEAEQEQVRKAPALAKLLVSPTPKLPVVAREPGVSATLPLTRVVPHPLSHTQGRSPKQIGISGFKTFAFNAGGPAQPSGLESDQLSSTVSPPQLDAKSSDKLENKTSSPLPQGEGPLAPAEPIASSLGSVTPSELDNLFPDCFMEGDADFAREASDTNRCDSNTFSEEKTSESSNDTGSVKSEISDQQTDEQETVTVMFEEDTEMSCSDSTGKAASEDPDAVGSQDGDTMTVTIEEDSDDSSQGEKPKGSEELSKERSLSPDRAGAATPDTAAKAPASSCSVSSTTDDDASQDSVSAALPDLRPASSCSSHVTTAPPSPDQTRPDASPLPHLPVSTSQQEDRGDTGGTGAQHSANIVASASSNSKSSEPTKSDEKTPRSNSDPDQTSPKDGVEGEGLVQTFLAGQTPVLPLLSTRERDSPSPSAIATSKVREATVTVPFRLGNGTATLQLVPVRLPVAVGNGSGRRNAPPVAVLSSCAKTVGATISTADSAAKRQVLSLSGLTIVPLNGAAQKRVINGKLVSTLSHGETASLTPGTLIAPVQNGVMKNCTAGTLVSPPPSLSNAALVQVAGVNGVKPTAVSFADVSKAFADQNKLSQAGGSIADTISKSAQRRVLLPKISNQQMTPDGSDRQSAEQTAPIGTLPSTNPSRSDKDKTTGQEPVRIFFHPILSAPTNIVLQKIEWTNFCSVDLTITVKVEQFRENSKP